MMRLFQRYPPKLWMLSIIPIIVISLFIYLDDEYSAYTATSLQSMSDKVKSFTEAVDEWRKENLFSSGEYDPNFIDLDLVADPSSSEAPKGVILMFAKTMDLYDVYETVRTVEDRFNRKYGYDWMIVTDAKHSENFKKSVTALITNKVEFVSVAKREGLTSETNLDSRKLKETKAKIKKLNTDSRISMKTKLYQKFWSFSLLQIEELENYDYFLRVTPGTQLMCDINIDLFQFMKINSKSYGFGLATKNEPNIFEKLWPLTLSYISKNPRSIHSNNLIDLISDDNGENFNNCQFDTQFEIGYLKFFRSERYTKLMEYYIESKGIFYENWQDGTLRTIAVSLLNDKNHVQFFNNIAIKDYKATTNIHDTCPYEHSFRLNSHCICDPLSDITWNARSCVEKFYNVNNAVIPSYVEEHKHALFEKSEQEKNSQENRVQEAEAERIKIEDAKAEEEARANALAQAEKEKELLDKESNKENTEDKE